MLEKKQFLWIVYLPRSAVPLLAPFSWMCSSQKTKLSHTARVWPVYLNWIAGSLGMQEPRMMGRARRDVDGRIAASSSDPPSSGTPQLASTRACAGQFHMIKYDQDDLLYWSCPLPLLLLLVASNFFFPLPSSHSPRPSRLPPRCLRFFSSRSLWPSYKSALHHYQPQQKVLTSRANYKTSFPTRRTVRHIRIPPT